MKNENVIPNDFKLGCNIRTIDVFEDSELLKTHFHKEIELVIAEAGDICVNIFGDKINLPEGSIFYIGRKVPHSLEYKLDAARVTYIQIDIDTACRELFPDTELFSYFLSSSKKSCDIFTGDSDIGMLVLSIQRELEEKRTHYTAAVKGAIYQLVANLLRNGLFEDNSYLKQSPLYKKILPALNYARDNFYEKITLDTICSNIKIDKYNFCKQFKKITGVTFFDYLTFLRIKHAEELLVFTDKNITEISLDCGFSSVQYFTKIFTSKRGCTPTKYRDMLKSTEIF